VGVPEVKKKNVAECLSGGKADMSETQEKRNVPSRMQ
jgi:hypothetical protein